MIAEETPVPKRSVALDLMMDSGGRLSDRDLAALRVISDEPGLGNGKVGDRVGAKDHAQISYVLARLARRGLIESALGARAPFAANSWHLTPAGVELDAAIRDESQDGA